MIQLLDTGAYLVNGTDLVADNAEAAAAIKAKTGREVDKAKASKETIAYGILKSHNTADSMEKLKIKFDKLTSHDITFVGIIQTARASGLTRFPVPYVLTNCHNSLCAVGGTRRLCTAAPGSDPSVCAGDARGRRKDDPRLGFPHALRCARHDGDG